MVGILRWVWEFWWQQEVTEGTTGDSGGQPARDSGTVAEAGEVEAAVSCWFCLGRRP